MALFLWAALLIFLAIEPGPVMEIFLPTESDRVIAHAFMYGLMAFLFCIFFEKKWGHFDYALSFWQRLTVSLFLTFVLGCWTEVLQIFSIERTPDAMDVVFDSLGGLVGVAIYGIRDQLRMRIPAQR